MPNQITKSSLIKFYIRQKKSAVEIAKVFQCSPNRINYWLAKYTISKRDISEAIYSKHHPHGDPFKIYHPKTLKEAILFGLGVGIYWGEGNKANKNTIRVGNSDPKLLNVFIKFLQTFFKIKKKDLKFHLHIFTDINKNEALRYWSKQLKIRETQFYKPMVSISGSLGTYRQKSKYGVLTLYYANTKLKNILMNHILKYPI